ncbi:MAG: nuclear transport factor 2 family protein [Erysipelotrichaceae bacterium]|nr:nuclear transport factor 2 family protein [Erysipelotrichaceae bacterium]
MDIKTFFEDVIKQDRERLKTYFHENALINWHCSNESFHVDEYIRVNCDYPGSWKGEIERLEENGNELILAARVYSQEDDSSYHVVSFIRLKDDRIISMDEYWAEDEEAPEWRKILCIGRKIK